MTRNLLSQIRIVESGRILPFEWSGRGDSPNDQGGEESRYIRHPLPVLELPNGQYLLLDGADTFATLDFDLLNHMPVQLCTRKGIRVATEPLGLIDFDLDALYRIVARHPEQILLETPRTREGGYQTATIRFPNQAPTSLYFRDSIRSGCPASIDLFFRSVLQHGDYRPAVEEAQRPEKVFRSASFSAFLSLPQFSLDQLIGAATSERLFPPGLITVQIDSRVFYIDFPQSVLQSDLPVREKESFLKELILLREQARRTTHYHGQIHILNR